MIGFNFQHAGQVTFYPSWQESSVTFSLSDREGIKKYVNELPEEDRQYIIKYARMSLNSEFIEIANMLEDTGR